MSTAAVNVLAVLQARCGSTRLPGKVLKPILGEPMLARQVERVKRSRLIDRLVIATSDDSTDDALAALGARLGVDVYRGSLDDVLDRFYQAAKPYAPRWIVRLTGDCPLADPQVIDDAIRMAVECDYDYVANGVQPTYPDGLDVEIVRADLIELAWQEAKLPSQREHVTSFFHTQPQLFRIGHLRHDEDFSALRWTVDEPADFELVSLIYQELYPANHAFTWRDVLALVRRRPELATLNTGHARNEGYAKSLEKDRT